MAGLAVPHSSLCAALGFAAPSHYTMDINLRTSCGRKNAAGNIVSCAGLLSHLTCRLVRLHFGDPLPND
ncbi:hypothetical protein N7516_006986 [Penicillium verrucosum]|uniref:uncharacterized protein n=1 Tax=Penicillium verrucosum TaxID=60171 RepID=UPI0025451151|nr:uncharacterized protein N7516_006986 [Penicillium verrucosum]KAJ5932497.1 hypothetical protein N7516_006986 [Penicillium verrucosum]